MLTGRADGSILKPFVVFKRKRPIPELEKKFPGSVIDVLITVGSMKKSPINILIKLKCYHKNLCVS